MFKSKAKPRKNLSLLPWAMWVTGDIPAPGHGNICSIFEPSPSGLRAYWGEWKSQWVFTLSNLMENKQSDS